MTLNPFDMNGSHTVGYFAWSFLDLFELLDGYKTGYGLYYVDLDDNELTRYPKLSAHWYAGFLKGKNMSGFFENVDVKDTFSSMMWATHDVV
ncbi:putative beta-glucosidase [Helianthus debilis subsp. tardiflorus]